jgi:hypothetical protein
MQIPDRIPATKWFSILWVVYMVIWTMLEGGLWATVFAALLTTIVMVGWLFNRFLYGRTVSTGGWLLLSAVLGAAVGISSGLLTLALMAIKTGLHAHGPEFSGGELDWVLQQIPMWALAGLLGGLGLGFLLKAD